jgi:hypothetical protein
MNDDIPHASLGHDVTRDGYALNGKKGYSRVRRLQGRIFTDADFNEQVDLADRRLRDAFVDLVGPHAGPAGDLGFAIATDPDNGQKGPLRDLKVGEGAYYVDGVRVANDADGAGLVKDLGGAADDLVFDFAKNEALLVFLDVYSVAVTPLDDPDLIDPGFGGRDSSDRDRWAWSVRTVAITPPPPPPSGGSPTPPPPPPPPDPNAWFKAITRAQIAGFVNPNPGGVLFAIGSSSVLADDRCVVLPDVAAFTGPQDQLYRVEVHRSGVADDAKGGARFKWSRDNAAPAFAVAAWGAPDEGDGSPTWAVALKSLDALGGLRAIEEQHWVEVLTPGWEARAERLPLLWVESIDPDAKSVTLSLGKPPPADPTGLAAKFDGLDDAGKAVGTKLVLWDHPAGDAWGLAAADGAWPDPANPAQDRSGLTIEHGLVALVEDAPKTYRAGDYWTYAARSADAAPAAAHPDLVGGFRGPEGEHLYAPLLVVTVTNDANQTVGAVELRKKFASIGVPADQK